MRFSSVFALLVVLIFSTCASAEILTYNCANDGDGAIDCLFNSWNEAADGAYDMGIVGNQFWGPGHMFGNFTTDTPDDPVINVLNSVDNYSGFDWTGYHINVMLNTPFTISNAAVTLPGDWTASMTQPVFIASIFVDGVDVGPKYVGQVDYTCGTPVASGTVLENNDGGTLDFRYKISFSGSTSYTFIQEMAPVPEPGTLALLACGLVGLFVARRRFAR